MKSFKFQLDSVLDYKNQVLDSLMIEHGTILAQLRRQTEILESVRSKYAAYNAEYTEKKELGMTIADALQYQGGLHVLERDIAREREQLHRLEKIEEEKRSEVVDAKIDTSSIEKLRKIKRDLYAKAVTKEEEAMLDELVASRRAIRSV